MIANGVSSSGLDSRWFARTVEEGDACIRDLHRSMSTEYTQVVCVEGYWSCRTYRGTIETEADAGMRIAVLHQELNLTSPP